ncbi:MAG: ABC transporter ATP-binding protein [Fidelibacterota bacterium]
MLHIAAVAKYFNTLTAVDGVDFTVSEGAIYGFLGPNGAGKTTTIRMIMGIIEPDSGSITFKDKPIRSLPVNTFGYLPEERGLYQKQKLLDTIVYFGTLKGLSESEARKKAIDWIDRFDLTLYSDKKTEELSKGNQQKVQFIITLLHDPQLVVLDEPFTGLDPVNQLLLKEIIQEKQQGGTTFLFSTHQMEQVERLCTNICLINKGKMLLEGALDTIRNDFHNNQVVVEYEGQLDQKGLDTYLENPTIDERKLSGIMRADSQPFIAWLNDQVTIKDYSLRPPTLEEIFIATVKAQS